MPRSFNARSLIVALTATAAVALPYHPPAVAAAIAPSAVVAPGINDAITVPLVRDLPAALRTAVDMGKLDDRTLLPHIRLTLTRPAALQAALDTLAREQTVKGSPNYHRWRQPSQLRAYGPAQADIDRVTGWLASRGLRVNSVSPSGMSIDFGGTSAAVAAAFHTQLHHVLRAGEAHLANVTAPTVPAALSSVVTGVTLADFFPKPQMRRIAPKFTVPGTSTTPPFYAVGPADFAKIYNVDPLRNANLNFYGKTITGAGVTLAMVEQTLISTADVKTFRSAFKLDSYKGKVQLTHPGGCPSPGFIADEGEAALDVEWSGAVAPDATILEASCAGSAPFEFGVMNALMNLVELPTPATVLSISYGGDEIANGFAFQAAWSNLLEEGAVEGKAIFVSTGDSAVSANEGGLDTLGLFVNGLSDTAYNVAVGGTDFYDTALGQNAKYWSAKNTANGRSALSYIPEIPWDNSCSNSILYKYYGASSAIAFCNSAKGMSSDYTQNDVGGTGSRSVFYTKPYWQLTDIVGVPDDGVRDQPDVSLFAANGIWNHFYLFCMSDPAEGGAPCDYSKLSDVFGNAAGGTSFAAPAFAGIQALVVQSQGGVPLGNPAPVYYQIAKAQFRTPLGLQNCNSSLGSGISPACVFNYVTAGDNTAPCVSGTANCVSNAASTKGIGVPGEAIQGKTVLVFPARTGYSLATGLGTVNVTNLLYNYF